MRTNILTLSVPLLAVETKPRRRRESRDPYDGLRPWSAITHGAGAVLAAAGTLALLAGASPSCGTAAASLWSSPCGPWRRRGWC